MKKSNKLLSLLLVLALVLTCIPGVALASAGGTITLGTSFDCTTGTWTFTNNSDSEKEYMIDGGFNIDSGSVYYSIGGSDETKEFFGHPAVFTLNAGQTVSFTFTEGESYDEPSANLTLYEVSNDIPSSVSGETTTVFKFTPSSTDYWRFSGSLEVTGNVSFVLDVYKYSGDEAEQVSFSGITYGSTEYTCMFEDINTSYSKPIQLTGGETYYTILKSSGVNLTSMALETFDVYTLNVNQQPAYGMIYDAQEYGQDKDPSTYNTQTVTVWDGFELFTVVENEGYTLKEIKVGDTKLNTWTDPRNGYKQVYFSLSAVTDGATITPVFEAEGGGSTDGEEPETEVTEIFFIPQENTTVISDTTIKSTWGGIGDGTGGTAGETCFVGYIGYVVNPPEGSWTDDTELELTALPASAFSLKDSGNNDAEFSLTSVGNLLTIGIPAAGEYTLMAADASGALTFGTLNFVITEGGSGDDDDNDYIPQMFFITAEEAALNAELGQASTLWKYSQSAPAFTSAEGSDYTFTGYAGYLVSVNGEAADNYGNIGIEDTVVLQLVPAADMTISGDGASLSSASGTDSYLVTITTPCDDTETCYVITGTTCESSGFYNDGWHEPLVSVTVNVEQKTGGTLYDDILYMDYAYNDGNKPEAAASGLVITNRNPYIAVVESDDYELTDIKAGETSVFLSRNVGSVYYKYTYIELDLDKLTNGDTLTPVYTYTGTTQSGTTGGYTPAPSTPKDEVTNNSGTATEAPTTNADLTQSTTSKGNETTTTVDQTVADKIVENAVANKSEEVVINATAKNEAASQSTKAATVEVPTETIQQIAEKTEAAVTIKTDVAEIKLDTEALAAVADQAEGKSVSVVAESVKADAKEVRVELKIVCSEGKTISDFRGGSISVTVEAPKGHKDVVCVYIDEQGHMHKVPGQLNADGTYTFTTGHFSTYAIMSAADADAAIAAQKEAVKNVQLKLRSANSKTSKGKKAIKLTVSEVTDTGIDFDGYVIYRSTKKTSGYKKIYTTKTGTYYNTSAKKGVKYYYKAKGFVTIDGEKVYTGWSKKAIRTAK